ncbi:hypothetical protein RB653_005425 [Dictyostelium firmibasis]|uniref:Uncharacterized protein n=1 Tax=Dictyostelium firmibasis TaxID=79012 RepID=A0AAN7U7D0_9MYCE
MEINNTYRFGYIKNIFNRFNTKQHFETIQKVFGICSKNQININNFTNYSLEENQYYFKIGRKRTRFHIAEVISQVVYQEIAGPVVNIHGFQITCLLERGHNNFYFLKIYNQNTRDLYSIHRFVKGENCYIYGHCQKIVFSLKGFHPLVNIHYGTVHGRERIKVRRYENRSTEGIEKNKH